MNKHQRGANDTTEQKGGAGKIRKAPPRWVGEEQTKTAPRRAKGPMKLVVTRVRKRVGKREGKRVEKGTSKATKIGHFHVLGRALF